MRLGRCCVELHYGPGMVLRTLLLFVLGFTKLRRKMGQNSSVKTVLNTVQARPQNGQIHLYNLRVLLQQQKLHCVPVSLASLRVTEVTSPGHIPITLPGKIETMTGNTETLFLRQMAKH